MLKITEKVCISTYVCFSLACFNKKRAEELQTLLT